MTDGTCIYLCTVQGWCRFVSEQVSNTHKVMSVCCTHFLVSIQTRLGRLRSVSHQLANLKFHLFEVSIIIIKKIIEIIFGLVFHENLGCVLGMPRPAPGCWPVTGFQCGAFQRCQLHFNIMYLYLEGRGEAEIKLSSSEEHFFDSGSRAHLVNASLKSRGKSNNLLITLADGVELWFP